MKVPMCYVRNTNLSELHLSTVAHVNKILKERKKIYWCFLKCCCVVSYLQFLTLKLLLLAAFWASPESLASCGECVSSCFLMPRGSRSHKSDALCWTPWMKENAASFNEAAWLRCVEIISIYGRPVPTTLQKKQKVFSPMMKKNKYGRINSFFFFFFSHQTVQWELKYHHPDTEHKHLKCTRTDESCH